jgi:hypothetical protein
MVSSFPSCRCKSSRYLRVSLRFTPKLENESINFICQRFSETKYLRLLFSATRRQFCVGAMLSQCAVRVVFALHLTPRCTPTNSVDARPIHAFPSNARVVPNPGALRAGQLCQRKANLAQGLRWDCPSRCVDRCSLCHSRLDASRPISRRFTGNFAFQMGAPKCCFGFDFFSSQNIASLRCV